MITHQGWTKGVTLPGLLSLSTSILRVGGDSHSGLALPASGVEQMRALKERLSTGRLPSHFAPQEASPSQIVFTVTHSC